MRGAKGERGMKAKILESWSSCPGRKIPGARCLRGNSHGQPEDIGYTSGDTHMQGAEMGREGEQR